MFLFGFAVKDKIIALMSENQPGIRLWKIYYKIIKKLMSSKSSKNSKALARVER